MFFQHNVPVRAWKTHVFADVKNIKENQNQDAQGPEVKDTAQVRQVE
jgi:hypothetical protein